MHRPECGRCWRPKMRIPTTARVPTTACAPTTARVPTTARWRPKIRMGSWADSAPLACGTALSLVFMGRPRRAKAEARVDKSKRRRIVSSSGCMHQDDEMRDIEINACSKTFGTVSLRVPASVLCVPSRSPVGRWDGGTSAEWQVCAESLESHKSLSLPTCRLVWVGGPGPPPRRFHGVLGISVLTQSGKHDSNPINAASRERHPRGTSSRRSKSEVSTSPALVARTDHRRATRQSLSSFA